MSVVLAICFCAITVINNKLTLNSFFFLFVLENDFWFSPTFSLSNNSDEFNKSYIQELGDIFNLKVMTTGIENLQNSTLCERFNAVIGNLVNMIFAAILSDLEVAQLWTVSTHNALINNLGFFILFWLILISSVVILLRQNP